MKQSEAIIVAAARTPIGSFCGSLKDLSAPRLGAIAIRGALERCGIPDREIDEVFMGCAIQAGLGQSPARQAALEAGLPESLPATTVNKVCASGLKAVMLGAQSILAGDNRAVIAGGMENMSRVPHYLFSGRTGQKLGDTTLVDGLLRDGLSDALSGRHMGLCGESCAGTYGITRQEQDAFALESYARATAAWEQGAFDREIVPVSITDRKGNTVRIDRDEEYRNVKTEKIPLLRPAF